MRTLIYIPLLLIIISISACHDLEENPEGIIIGNDILTNEDVEEAVFGGYGLIASEQLYGQQLSLLLLLRSDMCDVTNRETNGDRKRVNNFDLQADNQLVEDVWAQSYKVIAAENNAIQGAELLENPTERTTELIAEARFIRAFMYYHLVRLFGSIPYIDYVVENQDPIPQSTTTEIYQKILDDLTFAKEHLPFEQKNTDDEPTRNRPTKGTAAGFKASVHLTLKEFQLALEEAKWVMGHSDELNYKIIEEYKKLFRATETMYEDDAFEELMLTFDFKDKKSENNGQNKDYLAIRTGVYVKDIEDREGIELEQHADGQGESKAVPYWKVYNLWDGSEDKDRRKANMASWIDVEDDDWIDENGTDVIKYEDWLIDRPHIKKYATSFDDISDAGHTDHNYIAMRYAEVFLIAAEASYELGNVEDARNYINEMRDRDGTITQLLPLNTIIDIDMIIKERQLELGFEFKRWYDIIRKQLGPQTFGDGDLGLEPQENFDPLRDYLLPIPALELAKDPNLIQNPGY